LEYICLYKLARTVYTVLFSANLNCELTEISSTIYVRLYALLWLVYVMQLITLLLLGNERGMIVVSWNIESVTQALDKEIDRL
jgi:hypothetical protein